VKFIYNYAICGETGKTTKQQGKKNIRYINRK